MILELFESLFRETNPDTLLITRDRLLTNLKNVCEDITNQDEVEIEFLAKWLLETKVSTNALQNSTPPTASVATNRENSNPLPNRSERIPQTRPSNLRNTLQVLSSDETTLVQTILTKCYIYLQNPTYVPVLQFDYNLHAADLFTEIFVQHGSRDISSIYSPNTTRFLNGLKDFRYENYYDVALCFLAYKYQEAVYHKGTQRSCSNRREQARKFRFFINFPKFFNCIPILPLQDIDLIQKYFKSFNSIANSHLGIAFWKGWSPVLIENSNYANLE
jgi:hypothetical protein